MISKPNQVLLWLKSPKHYGYYFPFVETLSLLMKGYCRLKLIYENQIDLQNLFQTEKYK